MKTILCILLSFITLASLNTTNFGIVVQSQEKLNIKVICQEIMQKINTDYTGIEKEYNSFINVYKNNNKVIQLAINRLENFDKKNNKLSEIFNRINTTVDNYTLIFDSLSREKTKAELECGKTNINLTILQIQQYKTSIKKIRKTINQTSLELSKELNIISV